METVVANVDNVKFDIEVALEQQLGAQPLPFVGMDKSTSAVCEFYSDGLCNKGALCPFRHVKGDRTVVCKHWLRGLCKKGDSCEFLHEYNLSRMPECYFFTRFNACHNKECPFLHIDADSKIKPCPWYDRGFCRHGPHCRHKHIRKVLCLNYLAGFCPDGPECKFVHAQFELPQIDEIARNARKATIICHVCGEAGHKSYNCPQNENAEPLHYSSYGNQQNHPPSSDDSRSGSGTSTPHGRLGSYMGDSDRRGGSNFSGGGHGHGHPVGSHPGGGGGQQPYQPYIFHPRPQFRPHHRGGDRDRETHEGQPRRALEDVVCYKCGYKGHYANKCNKGHLAFLSNKAGTASRDQGRN